MRRLRLSKHEPYPAQRVLRRVVDLAPGGAFMRRRPYAIGGALVGFLVLGLGGLPAVASASTTVGLNLTAETHYSCPVSCATATTFSADGVGYSPGLGRVTLSEQGTVLPTESNGCGLSSEKWVVTTENSKSSIFLSTTLSTYCPTANPNMSLETDTLTVTGGTGLFRDATGGATLMLAVLTQPQVGGGALTGTITY